MIVSKKICVLGASGVGKTSLTMRFTQGFFPESFLSTVGVNIQHKTVFFDDHECDLSVWDIQGENYFDGLMETYLKGSKAIIFVVDGSNLASLNAIKEIKSGIDEKTSGEVPYILLINKADQKKIWSIKSEHLLDLKNEALKFYETSAKNGDNVEEAFLYLGQYLTK